MPSPRVAICFTYWLVSLEQKMEGEKVMRQLPAETQNLSRLGHGRGKSSPFLSCASFHPVPALTTLHPCVRDPRLNLSPSPQSL